jgi:hypothetical protein
MNREVLCHRLRAGATRRILACRERFVTRHVRMPPALERRRKELLSSRILFPLDREYRSVLRLRIHGCGL